MASPADDVTVVSDSEDEAVIDEDAAAPAAAAPAKPPLESRKKRRLALVPLEPPPQRPRGAGAGAAARASVASDEVIDLTGIDEAVSAAFRDWEVLDLTGGGEEEAAAPSARRAAAKREEAGDELWSERQKVHAFVAARGKALRAQDLAANPHAAVGQPLYEAFVKARRRCADKRVQLLFHGTPEANVDAICRHGLDPRRRGNAVGQALGPGEYFGKEAEVSAYYCQGGKKMLVFAVLSDRSGITHDNETTVVVHRSEHQLPLFVISFHSVDEKAVERSIQQQTVLAAKAAMAGGAGGAMAALFGGGAGPFGPMLPPPPRFMPFSGGGRVLSAPSLRPPMPAAAPTRHALCRAAEPLQRCGGCSAPLRRAELAISRASDGARGPALFHLRCARGAPWAAELPLQALLQEHTARAQRAGDASDAALTERELAVVYEGQR